MTRAEAIGILHQHFHTEKAVDLINALQEHGAISDNVIEPKDAATCDLVAYAERVHGKRLI